MQKCPDSTTRTHSSQLKTLNQKDTNWAKELSNGLINLNQMAERGYLNPSETQPEEMEEVKELFDFRVPESFFNQLDNEDPSIKNQVIPTKNELNFAQEEEEDPIGDEAFSPVEGITHRYADRVVLKPTYNCAVYCRFCFRRYKVSDSSANPSWEVIQTALNYISSHTEIKEVILTGGDPLTLTDKRLQKICDALSHMKHIKAIRFHSRIPTVLPSRVNDSLINILKSTGKAVWMVAHINSHMKLRGSRPQLHQNPGLVRDIFRNR